MSTLFDHLRDPLAQESAIGGHCTIAGWPGDPDVRIRRIVDEVDALPRLRVFAAEFDEYGSGYASFVEVKLTRRDDALVARTGDTIDTTGFGLLLCRLAPVAALLRSAFEAVGNDGGHAASLPDRDELASCPLDGFPEASDVPIVLDRHGYQLAEASVLLEPLAPGLEPDTNLGEPPWRVFDAWFHWHD